MAKRMCLRIHRLSARQSWWREVMLNLSLGSGCCWLHEAVQPPEPVRHL